MKLHADMEVDDDTSSKATLMTQDDTSSQGDASATRSVKFDASVIEKTTFTVKLETDGTSPKQDATTLFIDILYLIQKQFDDSVTILTNKSNRSIHKKRRLQPQEFEKYFQMQEIEHKGRKATASSTIYLICFSLKTETKFSQIKRDPLVSLHLRKHNLYMKYHPWRISQYDTQAIGWILGAHPGREQSDDIKTRITARVRDHKDLHLSKLPEYRLLPSLQRYKISATQEQTAPCYEIHCLREDKSQLETILSTIYKETHNFIRFSMKYHDSELYRKALQMQEHYTTNFRSIKITGVTSSMLFYFLEKIKAITGVTSITEPWNSETSGKWLINTNKVNFHQVGQTLQDTFNEWLSLVPEEALPSPIFQEVHPPTVHFRTTGTDRNPQNSDDISVGTVQSYDSQAKTVLTQMYDAINTERAHQQERPLSTAPPEIHIPVRPPLSTNSVPKSWASIVSHSSLNDSSDITTSNSPPHTEEPLTTHERAELYTLRTQLSHLQLELSRLKTKEYNSTTPPTISPAGLPANHSSKETNILQRMEARCDRLEQAMEQQQAMFQQYLQAISTTATTPPTQGPKTLPQAPSPSTPDKPSKQEHHHNLRKKTTQILTQVASLSPPEQIAKQEPPPYVRKKITPRQQPSPEKDPDNPIVHGIHPPTKQVMSPMRVTSTLFRDGKRRTTDESSHQTTDTSASENTRVSKKQDAKSTPQKKQHLSKSTIQTTLPQLNFSSKLLTPPSTDIENPKVPASAGQSDQ